MWLIEIREAMDISLLYQTLMYNLCIFQRKLKGFIMKMTKGYGGKAVTAAPAKATKAATPAKKAPAAKAVAKTMKAPMKGKK